MTSDSFLKCVGICGVDLGALYETVGPSQTPFGTILHPMVPHPHLGMSESDPKELAPQVVLDHRISSGSKLNNDGVDLLKEYWGSLGVSILTLFQAISSGQDWGLFVVPLSAEISEVSTMRFTLQIVRFILSFD